MNGAKKIGARRVIPLWLVTLLVAVAVGTLPQVSADEECANQPMDEKLNCNGNNPTETHETCGYAGCTDYYQDGNQYCDSLMYAGWFMDTDGDLFVDCLDPDDDGDRLTDELEDWYAGYSQTQANADGDVNSNGEPINDAMDVCPHLAKGCWIDLKSQAYVNVDDCDIDTDPWFEYELADPYITNFDIRIAGGPSIQLLVPDSWSSAANVEDRGDGVYEDLSLNSQAAGLMTAGHLDLPDSLAEYALKLSVEYPGVTLRISLYDQDVAIDNPIDLTPGSETAATFEVSLMNDELVPAHATFTTQGDTDCSVRIGFSFVDSVCEGWIRTAMYARDHPNELVGIATKLPTQCTEFLNLPNVNPPVLEPPAEWSWLGPDHFIWW